MYLIFETNEGTEAPPFVEKKCRNRKFGKFRVDMKLLDGTHKVGSCPLAKLLDCMKGKVTFVFLMLST